MRDSSRISIILRSPFAHSSHFRSPELYSAEEIFCRMIPSYYSAAIRLSLSLSLLSYYLFTLILFISYTYVVSFMLTRYTVGYLRECDPDFTCARATTLARGTYSRAAMRRRGTRGCDPCTSRPRSTRAYANPNEKNVSRACVYARRGRDFVRRGRFARASVLTRLRALSQLLEPLNAGTATPDSVAGFVYYETVIFTALVLTLFEK